MRYLVIGAAGHAQEVAWTLSEAERRSGRTIELLFFDDGLGRGPVASGLGDVVGTIDDVSEFAEAREVALVLGVGLPRLKTTLVERLAGLGLAWQTVVHPDAIIGPNSRIGEGSYVAAGAVVTVNALVGRFATINMHCQVAHDCIVEDFVSLHPNTHLGGNVRVEAAAELGTGVTVIPGLTIGRHAVLGAGSTAVRSLAGGAIYVGTPARILRDGTSWGSTGDDGVSQSSAPGCSSSRP